MKTAPARIIVLGLLVASTSTAARAQSASCDSCLRITHVVDLSSSGGQFVPSAAQSVFRAADGRFLVSHLYVNATTQLSVYDARGRFLGLQGRKGKGPGEFSSAPVLSTGPRNTIWAFERERLLKFDQGLRPIETKRLEQTYVGLKAFALTSGIVVMNSRVADPQGGFFHVTVLDSNGRVLRRLERRQEDIGISVLAPASTSGFWALPSNQLELHRYSDDARFLKSVRLTNDFFQPFQGADKRNGREGLDFPPRPQHAGLLDPGNDLLIVLTAAPDAQWTRLSGLPQPSTFDANRQYDTVIWVVDLRTGRTISTKRAAEYLNTVNGAPGLAFSTRQDNNGHVTTSIVRLQARRP